MSHLEDLLRDATRSAASAVDPAELPPLELSGMRFGRGQLSFGRGGGLQGRGGILGPALAAVLVIAVVALSLAVPRLLHVARPARPGAPAGLTAAGIPRYYLTGSGPEGTRTGLHPVSALVVDSQTGHVAATIAPPAGYASFAVFGNATADDLTFVVGVQQAWEPAWDNSVPGGPAGSVVDNNRAPVTFFLLTFDPATGKAAFRQLPTLTVLYWDGIGRHPAPPTPRQVLVTSAGTPVVSPDGSRVAVGVIGYAPDQKANTPTVEAWSLASGSWRAWDLNAASPFFLRSSFFDNLDSLSWSPDNHTLVISSTSKVGLLDTSGPGGHLPAAARVVSLSASPVPGTTPPQYFRCGDSADTMGPKVTGNGTELACVGQEGVKTNGYDPAAAVGIYSLATGRLLSVTSLKGFRAVQLWGGGLGWEGTAWTSQTGSVLITTYASKAPMGQGWTVAQEANIVMMVVSGGQVHRIPLPAWTAKPTVFRGPEGTVAW